GGASTVRGYGEQLLGPVVYDDNGNPLALGGRYQFLVNLELRIPLFWRLYGELFIDGGNVWSGISEIDPSSIKFTSGAGVAFMTPLGAIRFDYGVKWAPEPQQAPDQFHVGLSWAFLKFVNGYYYQLLDQILFRGLGYQNPLGC
ncbi:MAG: BamA/TamA family outer membrane protein, partial [Calditrichia bacterium]